MNTVILHHTPFGLLKISAPEDGGYQATADRISAELRGLYLLEEVVSGTKTWSREVCALTGNTNLVAGLEADLQRGSLERYYMGVYCLWLKQKNGQPHFPMSFYTHRVPSDSGYYYGYGLYYHVPKADTAGLAALKTYYSRLQALTHSLNGRLYNYSWHDWSVDTYRDVYGPDWTSHVDFKRQLDPEMFLNADVLPFE